MGVGGDRPGEGVQEDRVAGGVGEGVVEGGGGHEAMPLLEFGRKRVVHIHEALGVDDARVDVGPERHLVRWLRNVVEERLERGRRRYLWHAGEVVGDAGLLGGCAHHRLEDRLAVLCHDDVH